MTRFDQRVLDAVRNSALPTVGGITQRLGCTPNMVSKALRRLRTRGYVERDPEAGLVVWKVADK